MATGNTHLVNRLLDALPTRDRRRMLAKFDSVELYIADVLYNLGETLDRVYFSLDCFISLVMPIDDTSLEVGLVGSEGMFGIPLALGDSLSATENRLCVRQRTYTIGNFAYWSKRMRSYHLIHGRKSSFCRIGDVVSIASAGSHSRHFKRYAS